MNRRELFRTAAAAGAGLFLSRGGSSGQELVRYPDARIEVLDPRFARYRVPSAAIERLYTGCRWAEGPVWFGDGRFLLWSDIPNDRILRWVEETGEVSTFRSPSHHSNGHTRDLRGRLITCERKRVTRTESDGTVTVLVDSFEGKPLNGPNDVVVHPDGSIWFTDPGYGSAGYYEGVPEELQLPTSVYRLDPGSGEVTVATTELGRPNGIAFSPGFERLYVADTGVSHQPGHPQVVRVFEVEGDERLVKGRVFCDTSPGVADGIRCDVDGNLWASAGWGGDGYDGVHVYHPDGTRIGRIRLPEVCANLCFGGLHRNRLFMTASQSLYSLYVETQGVQVW